MNLGGTSSGTPCLVHEWEDCHNQKCFRHKQIWNNLPTDWKRKGWLWRSLNVLLMWFQGHTFRFSNGFYILNKFTRIKTQLLFLRTPLLVIIRRSFHRELTVPTGKEVGEVGNTKQAIKLVLLAQRCQDHLLGNIQWSVTHRDERAIHLQCPRKKQKAFFWVAFKCTSSFWFKSKKAS